MSRRDAPLEELRRYRNSALYRPLARVLRVYNRRLVDGLHARGFTDFQPAFPQVLSNLDTKGTRIGVLAARAGVSRQAAGQLVGEIERCGYVERRQADDDARATVVTFTPRGRKLLDAVFELVLEVEASFSAVLGDRGFERLRQSMTALANEIDPQGLFGVGDE
jgi:DNA-binding MarR family transcriptional regulator